MCLAVPGRVVKVQEDAVVVDYGSEQRVGRLIEGEVAVGDFVLIQGGIIVEKVDPGEAREALRLYQQACSSR
ncbi:MAG: HypC/HybG/HupF family hydrogenase formation chaperone [Nanoarchaeota archaeon]